MDNFSDLALFVLAIFFGFALGLVIFGTIFGWSTTPIRLDKTAESICEAQNLSVHNYTVEHKIPIIYCKSKEPDYEPIIDGVIRKVK